MAVNVIIPTALRQYAGNNSTVSIEGATVGEALQSLTSRFPDFGKQLFDAEGKLRSFVNIYRNDDDVRYLEGLDTPIGERDDLSIIPAIAGGRTYQAEHRTQNRPAGRCSVFYVLRQHYDRHNKSNQRRNPPL